MSDMSDAQRQAIEQNRQPDGKFGSGPRAETDPASVLGEPAPGRLTPVSWLRPGMSVDRDGDGAFHKVVSTDGDHKSISVEFEDGQIESYELGHELATQPERYEVSEEELKQRYDRLLSSSDEVFTADKDGNRSAVRSLAQSISQNFPDAVAFKLDGSAGAQESPSLYLIREDGSETSLWDHEGEPGADEVQDHVYSVDLTYGSRLQELVRGYDEDTTPGAGYRGEIQVDKHTGYVHEATFDVVRSAMLEAPDEAWGDDWRDTSQRATDDQLGYAAALSRRHCPDAVTMTVVNDGGSAYVELYDADGEEVQPEPGDFDDDMWEATSVMDMHRGATFEKHAVGYDPQERAPWSGEISVDKHTGQMNHVTVDIDDVLRKTKP